MHSIPSRFPGRIDAGSASFWRASDTWSLVKRWPLESEKDDTEVVPPFAETLKETNFQAEGSASVSSVAFILRETRARTGQPPLPAAANSPHQLLELIQGGPHALDGNPRAEFHHENLFRSPEFADHLEIHVAHTKRLVDPPSLGRHREGGSRSFAPPFSQVERGG